MKSFVIVKTVVVNMVTSSQQVFTSDHFKSNPSFFITISKNIFSYYSRSIYAFVLMETEIIYIIKIIK